MSDLSRIDWNLLPALDALLTERNVTRAARRLGVTQPAMSNALQRLRRHFRDELLTRHGNGYLLTPLAERLAPRVRDHISSGLSIVGSIDAFDPLISTRRFVIAGSEAMQVALAPSLTRALNEHAPAVTFSFVAPFVEPFRTYDDIVAGTDGWFAPREMMPNQSCTGLMSDSWVCVVDLEHPEVGDALTLADAQRLPWVAPTIRGAPLRVHVDALMAHGVEPVVEVFTESFTAVPFLVAGTTRLGIMQRAVAERLAPAAGVRILECPWAVQPLHVTFWWDLRWESDPAHTWLRSVVDQVMDGRAPRPGLA
ncbi:LysR family transcriptional regulator [Nocardioides sp. 1609]|uniref:LysR family transcriptional regulator n=1 Tax=Nocardioides sp. 1609 TaxID=2508327 RepID=UPI001430F650|nr:LysR family transcriptional regulator [Nocardioides sp. 1609]